LPPEICRSAIEGDEEEKRAGATIEICGKRTCFIREEELEDERRTQPGGNERGGGGGGEVLAR
jgi:hypothetical protein